MMPHRMWCKVGAIKNTTIYAFTVNDELVLMRKGDLEGVQTGDIVSFIPLPPRTGAGFNRSMAKFFGAQPRIIARGIPYPITRDGSTAVEWKQKQETRAEINGLREVHAGAGRSGLGVARASESV